MAELLDRIHAEIRERLAASRGAMEEYERLQAALTALEGGPSAARPPRRRRTNGSKPAAAAREAVQPRVEPAAVPEPATEEPRAEPAGPVGESSSPPVIAAPAPAAAEPDLERPALAA